MTEPIGSTSSRQTVYSRSGVDSPCIVVLPDRGRTNTALELASIYGLSIGVRGDLDE